jgi:hypothetical protein
MIDQIVNSMITGLSDVRMLILGTARDCEDTIRKDVFRLCASLGWCQTLNWFVVESDSSDGTVRELQSIANSVPGFRYASLGNLRESFAKRTQRLAYCRNLCLDQLWSNSLYSDVNYVMIADLDGTNELVTEAGSQSCWMRSGWGVCTANQRGPYYDIWALRHHEWNPGDCWRQYRFLVKHGIAHTNAVWAAVYHKMIKIDEMEDWIEVDSAFGGLAVYRREVLNGLSYIGLDEAGHEICEHVSLNAQIKANGHRIFINPRLINAGVTPATKPLRILNRGQGHIVDAIKNAKRAVEGLL